MPHSLPVFKPEGYAQVKTAEDDKFRVKGSISYLDPSVAFDPALIPDKMLSCMASFSVTGSGLNDSRFRKLQEEPETVESIKSALSDRTPSLSSVYSTDCDPACVGQDRVAWGASLNKGFFAIGRSGGAFDFKNYKLIVYVPNDQMTRELKSIGVEMRHKNLDMTIGEFMSTAQFRNARSLATRNICRAAEQIAGAIGVKLSDYQPDDRARRVGRGQPTPVIAVPESLGIFGNMVAARVQMEDGRVKNTVVVSDRMCTPLDTVGPPLVPLGALAGTVVMNSDNSRFTSRYITKADLERLSIPSGPRHREIGEHTDSDKAYISTVCFWDSENVDGLPKALRSDPQASTSLQSHLEQAYSSTATRLNYMISYQAS